MIRFGYSALSEQVPAGQLVTDLVAAERAGFDFASISDHYSPWLETQGHSAYAWSVLGAAAHATQWLPLMTCVTCPAFRYHPAVVAQKAATVGALSRGRFTLGLGAGENLNEHVVGGGWPAPRVRHERLSEAVQIIRRLLDGGYVTYRGRHFEVERAKLYDLPETPPPIALAVSGPQSVRMAAEQADAMISVEPSAGLVERFSKQGGAGKRKYGQLPVCYDRDEKAALRRAREQWRWAAGGWPVMAELPDPGSFDAYSRQVREEDISQSVSCGPDTGQHVNAVKQYVDAGFTDIALVQVGGGSQPEFASWAHDELLPALRELR